MQKQLEDILKKKGVGPQGSKSLQSEDLILLTNLIRDSSTSITTRCTLMLAILMLEPNAEEEVWISEIRNQVDSLEEPIKNILIQHDFSEPSEILHSLLQHQELSKEQCSKAMQLLWEPSTPDHWKGCFLEGERLKRETQNENAAFLNDLWEKSSRIQTDLPQLIDLADNYDGYNRYHNYLIFLAPALAACGQFVSLHGIDAVAPKQGYTAHTLLSLAGKKTNQSLWEASNTLQTLGWSYVDQSVFFPELYSLKKMRKEMVKRPFLATFEKLLQPIRAQNGNLIVTGYTHSHYKDEVILQLKNQGACAEALVIKGLEGNPQLPLGRPTTVMHYNGKDILEYQSSPEEANIPLTSDFLDKSVSANRVLEEGIAALKGATNEARNRIVYMSYLLASKFRLDNPEDFVKKIKSALDSGAALEKWNQFN
jgi:anthranilate phosphoribosyltransferase